MTEPIYVLVIIAIYKVCILISGTVLAYLGYRLFLADKTNEAGDLSVKVPHYAVSLKGGAPGVFFSLFGAALIAISLLKGISYDEGGIARRSTVGNTGGLFIPDRPPG